MKLDLHPIPYTEFSSKWIIDIGQKLHNPKVGNAFLDTATNTQATIRKQTGLQKMNNSEILKDTVNRVKRQPIKWKKHLQITRIGINIQIIYRNPQTQQQQKHTKNIQPN